MGALFCSHSGGLRYFVIFVNDFSRYTWIYLMKNRSKVLTIYRDFAKMIQTQYSKAIKVFRSDNAREYRQTNFFTILKHYDTIFHTSCPGTSQQNGTAKRKLHHILDTIRALTNAASTLVSFWGEAALTAVYTINRCPSLVIQNTTPYERLFGTTPNYSLLKVFDYVCFVLLQPHERTKLQLRSQLCCFLGYGLEEKGCHAPNLTRSSA
jgi:transposase InsO family protein